MRIGSIALVAATLALGACGGGDKATGAGGTLAGSYTLRTVNGGSLPATIAQLGNDKLEVTGGSVTMNDNNTFSGDLALRETISGVPDNYTASCTGTYTRTGNTITFTEPETDDCGGTYSGTWSSGNTLTVAYAPGISAVFKK